MSLNSFVKACELDEKINIKSFMIIKDDKVIGKFTKSPYKFDDLSLVFSVAKSLTSIGIGIALDKGLIDLNTKLVDCFKGKHPSSISNNLKNVTLEHLLSMTSGITDDKVLEITSSDKDWVSEFLKLDFEKKPGTHYYYSTLCSHIISEIFTELTGKKLSDFLEENLFKPLEITEYDWGESPSGATLGGMGVSLSIESLSKIGLMLLNNGVYKEKRILSEDYIREATSIKVTKGIEKEYSGNGYGYQFHIIKDGYFTIQGAFGQLCIIVPDKKMVITLMSTYSKPTENMLKTVYEHIIDVDIEEDFNELNLSYKLPDITKNKVDRVFKNETYLLDKNFNRFEKLFFDQKDDKIVFNITTEEGVVCNLDLDINTPTSGVGMFRKDTVYSRQKYLAFTNWVNDNELEVIVYYLETPYIVNYRMKFSGDEIDFEYKMNVNLTMKNINVKGRLTHG